MKFSDFDFLSDASSINSKTFVTVDSPNSFVVLTFNNPFKLIEPEYISESFLTSFGRDSPVKAFVSREDSPSITIPSKGTFSPGLIIINEPISTSSGSTSIIFPFSSSIFA